MVKDFYVVELYPIEDVPSDALLKSDGQHTATAPRVINDKGENAARSTNKFGDIIKLAGGEVPAGIFGAGVNGFVVQAKVVNLVSLLPSRKAATTRQKLSYNWLECEHPCVL